MSLEDAGSWRKIAVTLKTPQRALSTVPNSYLQLRSKSTLERHLENQSYWFARMGQISLNLNPYGATFQDSDLAKLPEPPEDAWQTGRLNPSFGRSEIEKWVFKEVFQAIQCLLDLWRTDDGITVEAYALKELKISAARLVSLTTGLCALKQVHELVEVTVVKFWYDSVWLSKPVGHTK